jgi:hypothetical protein
MEGCSKKLLIGAYQGFRNELSDTLGDRKTTGRSRVGPHSIPCVMKGGSFKHRAAPRSSGSENQKPHRALAYSFWMLGFYRGRTEKSQSTIRTRRRCRSHWAPFFTSVSKKIVKISRNGGALFGLPLFLSSAMKLHCSTF